MNKAFLGIIALLTLAGIVIVASYQFSVKTHREVVEHRPPLPDIPGALAGMKEIENGRII